MPDGPSIGDFKGHARDALHLSATKIWAVKALGDLPESEWAPPKRRPRRFNVAFTLEGSANLDAETHGENVSEQLEPPRMRRAGVPFEVRGATTASSRRQRRQRRLPRSDSRAIRDEFLARSCRIRQRASSKKERPRRRAPETPRARDAARPRPLLFPDV